MQINKEFLKSLNPCADRYKNYLEHHGEFNGSFSDFLDLTNLDYNDKIWVAVRVLTKNQLINWSILFAESVVHIFEDKHPDDKRLSDCIEFLKTVDDFDNLTDTEIEEIKKHIDITRATTDATFRADFRAAAWAACAAQAARFATEFATESAFYAAKNAGENFTAAKHSQQALNLQFLKQVTSL